MKTKFIRHHILLLMILGLSLAACSEESADADATAEETTEETAGEVSQGLEESAMRPELVGKWKLVDMRMDNEPLPQSIPGSSFLEFLPDGSVALESEGFDADTASILQNGEMLMSDIWDSAQHIDSLTMGRLILSEDLDGTQISYIYTRQ